MVFYPICFVLFSLFFLSPVPVHPHEARAVILSSLPWVIDFLTLTFLPNLRPAGGQLFPFVYLLDLILQRKLNNYITERS